MEFSASDLSFSAEDSENKATASSRVGKVGSGSEAEMIVSGGLWLVSVGELDVCVTRFSEGGLVGGSEVETG